MKLQCDVCEKEEAEVLCCADEAVLCRMCDSKVHAANMLSRKHHRLLLLKPLASSLSSSSRSSSSLTSSSFHLPLCDLCKMTKAHVFCLEDRQLLCPICDISTHAASPYSAAHQRFLISGIRVALESSATCCSSDIGSSSTSSHHPGMPMTPPMDPSSAESKGFPAETDWPFNEHFCVTDDLAFYDFSESDAAASSKFSDW